MGASQTASGNLNDRGLDRENISTPVEAEPFSREPKKGGKSRPRSKVTFEFGMGVLALNHGLRQ
jgi:hypothetical protein